MDSGEGFGGALMWVLTAVRSIVCTVISWEVHGGEVLGGGIASGSRGGVEEVYDNGDRVVPEKTFGGFVCDWGQG